MLPPIVLFIFNRPALTLRALDAIRAARPPTLYVIADGPRPASSTDPDRVLAARRATAEIDWPCDVRRIYAEENLGCRRRIESGLDAVFEEEERAIIVEDDCILSPTFFPFCAELLERYAADPRVWTVGADNLFFGWRPTVASYHFSRLFDCLGWATWGATWRQHDKTMRGWKQFRAEGRLRDVFPDPRACTYWVRTFDAVSAGEIDSWALPFAFSSLAHGALHVVPVVNLVTNVGFGPDATHTRGVDLLDRISRRDLAFPLVHPTFQLPSAAADDFMQRVYFERRPLVRLRAAARRVLHEARRGEATYLGALASRLPGVGRRVTGASTLT